MPQNRHRLDGSHAFNPRKAGGGRFESIIFENKRI
jgi:hypothetical protein